MHTRKKLLLSLEKRRKTLTELSREVGLKLPTVRKHLAILEQKGSVVKVDEGRKWKYYELAGESHGKS